jgi:DNA-binding winged helix-turn-helix (wHTH) protein
LSEFEGLPTEYFDAEGGGVTVNGARRRMSPLQSRVLQQLWQRRRKVVSPHVIARSIYPPPMEPPDDALGVVTVTVCRLRKLLTGTPLRIETVYRRGYLLRVIVARPVANDAAASAAAAAALQPSAT